MCSAFTPGSVIKLRSASWKVLNKTRLKGGTLEIHCRGISGIVRDKEARFIYDKETNVQVLAPADITLQPDTSSGLTDTKLHLEAAFRHTPTTTKKPLTFCQAAIDDLSFQHLPVEKSLQQDRVRLLIADDVGLGKTLEAGLITSELILRGRANRILVVTTRAMLSQFQKEFWTRFSIPLARLDSAAIQRMRNRIPAHYNVFDQFDRSIVSIDTLKRDTQIRDALKHSRWDLIIIDEAHNAAKRKNTTGTKSQRAALAQLLSNQADSLLLLTATPHDGSQESFASLIEMLDPTRVPVPSQLKRKDIEDLVIRRFRSTPEVMNDLGKSVPQRELYECKFSLSSEEETAYQSIAELRLDLDENATQGRAIDLFRTTLAKAIFSSPAACMETLERRIQGIKNRTARGTETDLNRLITLRNEVAAVDTAQFSKYLELLKYIKQIDWTGGDRRDRIVIFSERIATVTWLCEHLRQDLKLKSDQVARVDGGSVEADTQTQKIIEDFGQERSPIRILIASDMASEGLNLHFQCHRLIHFDLPWSLLRFQQRNGRIDRYGQDRTPLITYFVAQSTHPKVRQMWVLDKLVEKDKAAQQGVGDPAVFLGVGDPELEEEVVAKAVTSGNGGDAFEKEMDDRAATVHTPQSVDDELDALFGTYDGEEETPSEEDEGVDDAPPRLFPDTFTYASAMLHRLSAPNEHIFGKDLPYIEQDKRLIRMTVPGDMKARDAFGYANKGDVDSRYMPQEAVSQGGTIELTDQTNVINKAIDDAKVQERAWPTVQYLWDCHPILEWFADHASTFFPEHSAPVASLSGRMSPGEVATIIHGAIPNAYGTPVVDSWAVVIRHRDGTYTTEDVQPFLKRTHLSEDTPNHPVEDVTIAQKAVPGAVDTFQTHLVNLRKRREIEIEEDLDKVLSRLAALETRFNAQLELELGEAPISTAGLSKADRRRLDKRIARKKKIDDLFNGWKDWFENTRRMVEDPNPYVEVKAVFIG